MLHVENSTNLSALCTLCTPRPKWTHPIIPVVCIFHLRNCSEDFCEIWHWDSALTVVKKASECWPNKTLSMKLKSGILKTIHCTRARFTALGGPWQTKYGSPVSATTYLYHGNSFCSFFLTCYNNHKFKLTLHDFIETIVAVPSMETIAVCGAPLGRPTRPLPPKSSNASYKTLTMTYIL